MNPNNEQVANNKELQESKENFAKSLFYIQLISLALAIIGIFLIN